MEWVIALLAIGCVFFSIQVVVDFVSYKKAIEPKIARASETQEQLRTKIEAAESELAEVRAGLNPARDEVQKLEKEFEEINAEMEDKAPRQQPTWKPPGTRG